MSFRLPRLDKSIWLMLVLMLILAFMTLAPLSLIIVGSFRSSVPGQPGFWTLAGYREAYTDPSIMKALWNTMWISVVRTAITMVLAVFFCWIIIRTDTPWKGLIEFFLWINFFLPTLPMTMGWILLLDPDYGILNQAIRTILPFIGDKGPLDIYTFAGIIWAHIGHSTAVRVLMFAPAFRNMDAALEDSSRMSGASNMTTLWRITFPLLIPSILGATVLGFVRGIEAFEIELLLGIPAGIYVYATKVYDLLRWEPPQYPPAMALSAVFMAIIFLIVLVNNRIIGRRQYVTVSGRGFAVRPIQLGKLKWATFALLVSYIVIFLLLPFSLLVTGTFMKVSGLFNVPEPFSTYHWRIVLSDPLFFTSIKNGLIMAGVAAIVGMLFYSIISYIVVRTRFKGRGVVDFLTWLPWAVPGILLAVGMLWLFLGTKVLVPLYGTIYILILAMIIKELPMGCRVMNGVMVQLGKELEESARTMGASWFHTFRRIIMPLLAPAFVATAVMIFLAAIRDIQLVVLLYSHKSRVISVLMLEYYIGLSPEKGMVVGLVIVAMVIVVAVTARMFGMRMGTRG